MIQIEARDLCEIIEAHRDGDNSRFLNVAACIADGLANNGHEQVGEYIMALLSGDNVFVPM